MANAVEYAYPGDKLTYTASGAIVGGRLAKLTGNRIVAEATADSTAVVGVALFDAADTTKVTVASKGVWGLTAVGAITAGQKLVAATNGGVKTLPTATGTYVQAETTLPARVIGIALEDIADTAVGRVKLTNLG